MTASPGVGKTHLAVSLGLKAIEAGYRVLFTTAASLIEKLTKAHAAAARARPSRRRLCTRFAFKPYACATAATDAPGSPHSLSTFALSSSLWRRRFAPLECMGVHLAKLGGHHRLCPAGDFKVRRPAAYPFHGNLDILVAAEEQPVAFDPC